MQDSPYHCDHPTTEIRKRTHSNGSIHFVIQCLRCGAALSAVKKTSVENHDVISAFDETLQDDFTAQAREVYQEQRTDERDEWFAHYNEYLKSPAWAQKRIEVLRRDQHICQGCRKHKATIAHHLSYAHVGNEFLFELTSLCPTCHKRIHDNE